MKSPNLNLYVVIIVVIVLVGGFMFYQNFTKSDFNLPRGGEVRKETIVISNEGQVIGTVDEVEDMENEEFDFETKEIMITNGVKHSVPLDKIMGGGPPKDGIPSIDDPKFIDIKAAENFLGDENPGIAISQGVVNRFYPFLILVWHEIVNDIINDQKVLVTYCPLCFSGIVFDPVVQGERVEFGTSGKLWNSNLVMYDRKTDSLWSQALGEAIVGEMTGTKLKILESDLINFGEFKKVHPNGEVLSKDTGAARFYGNDPYGDYYTSPDVFFPVDNTDDRLDSKDFILGIVIGEKTKAYFPEAIKKVGRLEDSFADKNLIIEYLEDIDAVRIFEKKSDNTLERINPLPSFWFAWVAIHPETELYK